MTRQIRRRSGLGVAVMRVFDQVAQGLLFRRRAGHPVGREVGVFGPERGRPRQAQDSAKEEEPLHFPILTECSRKGKSGVRHHVSFQLMRGLTPVR